MRVIDLFSGCGGMSLGFQNADFEIVAAFDNWKPSIVVYKANFEEHPIFEKDLSQDIDCQIFNKFQPDCIIGGPPCQDFSSAGKRDEDNGKGDLTISFAEIIAAVKPEWFVMENVERILKTNKLKDALSIFKSCGYGLSSQVLDASYCGVPQARKRFFLVGHLHSNDNFLDSYLLRNQSKQPMTVFDYLGHSLGVECYYRHPRSYARRGIFSIHEPSPTIRGVNRPIPKGYVPHEGDACKLDDKVVRPLTTVERAYIQTFPKNFQWFGTKTDLEQMIGNAVPVNLATHVAKCIKDYIQDLEVGQVKKRESQLAFTF
jgi:DNA (cytosine-5)-methyltransferase 1